MPTAFLALLLAAGAAAAAAQQPAGGAPPADEPESREIVVEGVRDRDRQIADFVESLTDAPILGQISRFDWAVCPAAVGLPAAQNAAAAERMRKVAAAAGIRVAPAGCRPNALLLVARDKRELIEQLNRKHPAYFEGLTRDQVNGLARSKGPAAAWHVEGRVDADGVPLTRDTLTGQYVIEATNTPSRITTSWRPHFVAAVVVVDVDSLAGLTVTQLADYAAMRAFARTDPARLDKSAAPTILNVLETPMGSAVPITITQWDLAFLKSLYASAENQRAARQRGEMKRIVREQLEGAPKGE